MEYLKQKTTSYRLVKGFIVFFMLFSAWFSYSHATNLIHL